MSATATRAPSAASRRTVAAPIPAAPPVTSAIRPSSRMAAQPIACAAMPDQVTSSAGQGRWARGSRCGWRRRACPSSSARATRSRPGGRRASQGAVPERRRPRARERPGGRGERDRVPHRPVPQPVRDADEPKNHLREGQLLVDATVPLAAAVSGKATRTLGVWQGSAAQQAQEMVPTASASSLRCTPSTPRASTTSTPRSTRTS